MAGDEVHLTSCARQRGCDGRQAVVLTSRDVRGSSAVLTAAGVAAILLGVLGLQIAEKMSKCKIRKDLNDSLDEALKDSVGFSHSIRKH